MDNNWRMIPSLPHALNALTTSRRRRLVHPSTGWNPDYSTKCSARRPEVWPTVAFNVYGPSQNMPRHQKALQDAQPLPANNDAMRVFRRVLFIVTLVVSMIIPWFGPCLLAPFVRSVYLPGALDFMSSDSIFLL